MKLTSQTVKRSAVTVCSSHSSNNFLKVAVQDFLAVSPFMCSVRQQPVTHAPYLLSWEVPVACVLSGPKTVEACRTSRKKCGQEEKKHYCMHPWAAFIKRHEELGCNLVPSPPNTPGIYSEPRKHGSKSKSLKILKASVGQTVHHLHCVIDTFVSEWARVCETVP